MDRIDRIYENMEEMRKTCKGLYSDKPCINMLEEPGFAQMTFMKRKARMIEKTLDCHEIRIFKKHQT